MSSIKTRRPVEVPEVQKPAPEPGRVSHNRSLAEQANFTPPKPTVPHTELARITQIEDLLDRSIHILDEQIKKQQLISKTATFDAKEVQTVDSLISSLIRVSKEQRERDKADDFSNMSDEELLTLFQSLMDKRGTKPK